MEIVTRGCSGLLYLNLSHCYVTDTTIRTLARYLLPLSPFHSNHLPTPFRSSRCGNLNHLSLAGCLHFTSRGLRYIQRGKGCRRLVYLDLSGCTKLTAEALQCIGVGCPILNTVLLDHIPSLSDSMIMVSGTVRNPEHRHYIIICPSTEHRLCASKLCGNEQHCTLLKGLSLVSFFET